MIQTSLLPEVVPERDFEIEIVTRQQKVKRSMHNAKMFKSLLQQVEKQQSIEMNRLTGGIVYRLLSGVGLLPKRRNKRWGYFIKE